MTAYQIVKGFYRSYVYMFSWLYTKYLRVLQVQIGDHCTFRGAACFRMKPNTKIVVGEGNSFFSSQVSNTIGVNHKCIFATLSKGALIEIGDNCGFSGTTISCFNKIRIGNNVRVGANAVIMDGDYHLDDIRTSSPKPVYIEDNVWIGYGCAIMKGVHIGKNSVIGINSVVVKDVPDNVAVAGNPARIIKEIDISVNGIIA